MTWFRLYSEILNDRKVQTIDPELFRTWINVLCVANENKRRGFLPPMPDLAFALRLGEGEAKDRIGLLVGMGLIDDTKEELRPHNWDARQFAPDSSTDRVNRHRARLKAKLLRAMPYVEYLATPHWRRRRKIALGLSGNKCSACNTTGGLDVHHNTYERLGEELDTDLLVLCRPCHDLFHENGKLAKP